MDKICPNLKYIKEQLHIYKLYTTEHIVLGITLPFNSSCNKVHLIVISNSV